MANALPPFPSFDLRATDANNIGLEWTKWVERFQNFLVACNITSDTRKKALLLHYVGEEVYDLFQSLPASTQTKQNVGESLDAFYARLRQLARHCGFADADLEIKSQIILATSSSRLRKYAMLHSLNLPDLLKQGRMFEDVERDVYEIEKNDGNAAVLAVHKDGQHGHHQRDGRRPPRKSHERQRPRVSSTECHNCGGKWPHQGGRSGCPAWGKTCNACNKVGHFARFCLSTKKMVQAVDCDSSPNKNSQSVCSKKCSSTKGHSASFETGSSSDEYAFVAMTFPQAGSSPQAVVTVNNVPVTFIIDTGATVSIMGENDFKSCGLNVNLQATSIRVFPYKATSPLELLGKVAVTMRYKDKCIEEDIFVIPGNCAPLLSFTAASNLGLVQITYQVHEQLNDKSIVKAFPKLFRGVGKLKNQHIHLFVDKTVPPVAQPHRRIPFALRNATEKELERLLSEDIIEPAIGPTPWVSPVVIVPKPHQPDEIRICIDMRVVNTAIQRERHLCPTVDDIIVALNGATVFSNLDLKNGYHQLELDAPSRQLTTFSTHVGLFRYKRLNFGISSAAEIFQNTIRQVLNGIPNVLNHTAGSSNPSDYLSRHPVPFEKPGRQIDKVPDEYVHFVQRHCIPKSFSIEEVAEQTKMDPQLKLVKEAIHNLQEKWQTAELKPFAAIRTELATTPDGLILRGTRLVLPTNLQERAIQLAHRGHQGIIKTKQLLREKVWFPGMDKLVHALIKGCLPCQAAVPQSSCEPLALTEPPNSPWEAVSVDFCGPFPDGKYAMVIVDDFSRYPVVHIISSTDARRVLPLLRAVFAQFGIPEQVRTDNGPPFQGAEFANFAEELGFRHHRVTPLWPQANGEVERFMRTLKKQVHTSQLENSDWKSELDTFLMSYRSTPQGTTKRTPYELLFGRPMRNLLPQYVPPPEAANKSGIRSTELQRKAYNKQYVDTRRHARPHRFFVGQQVLCKQQQKNKFTPYYDPLPYVITNISGSQIVASRGGRVIVRNASFFKDASGIVSTSPHSAEPGCDDLTPLPNTEAQAPEPLQPHKHPCRRYPTRDRKRPGHFDDYV
ncbi:hypothetical protein MTO96_003636 [Rhipicephalus appendiculatus]